MTHLIDFLGGVFHQTRCRQNRPSRLGAGVFLAFGLILAVTRVGAAPLNLTLPHYPDLNSEGTIGYVYKANGNPANQGGTFTIAGISTMTMVNAPGGVTTSFINGTYDLVATFDTSGNFTGGTLAVLGSSATDPTWGGPNIISADLVEFGFSGVGTAGTFEFALDNITGDMSAWGTTGGGVIVSALGMTGAGISGLWDPLNNTDMSFFPNNFSGTAFTIDTFVPVPAAAWLFGSALLGLFGVSRRKPATA
jgi:hypothetical protein